MRIQGIMARKIVIDEKEYRPQPRRVVEITDELPPRLSGGADLEFEVTVFNYLLNNKRELGISNVYRLKAACADGLLRLDTGEMVLLEIKYALGWEKSCQARIQFERFINEVIYFDRFASKCTHAELKAYIPRNGIIVFHHFSSDWNKPRKDREECGWVYFYEEEQVLNKSLIRTDILQLVDQKLIPY